MTHWEKIGVEQLQRVKDTLKGYADKWIDVLGMQSWDLTMLSMSYATFC